MTKSWPAFKRGKSSQMCVVENKLGKIRQGQIIGAPMSPAQGLSFIPQVAEPQKDFQEGSDFFKLTYQQFT